MTRKTKVTLAGLVAGIAAAAAVLAVVALGASGPPLKVHGDMEVLESCLSAGTDYPDIASGAQVVITDASGNVLAVTALGSMKDITTALNGVCDYPFTVTVPPGLPRYGVAIGHDRGTVWFTASQMRRGPALSLSPPAGSG